MDTMTQEQAFVRILTRLLGEIDRDGDILDAISTLADCGEWSIRRNKPTVEYFDDFTSGFGEARCTLMFEGHCMATWLIRASAAYGGPGTAGGWRQESLLEMPNWVRQLWITAGIGDPDDYAISIPEPELQR